ncbi:unnamed protein product, partial [Prorocentrum cordatum]
MEGRSMNPLPLRSIEKIEIEDSSGVDHSATNERVYAGVRPRVDASFESRDPSDWLRATKRGHFY